MSEDLTFGFGKTPSEMISWSFGSVEVTPSKGAIAKGIKPRIFQVPIPFIRELKTSGLALVEKEKITIKVEELDLYKIDQLRKLLLVHKLQAILDYLDEIEKLESGDKNE